MSSIRFNLALVILNLSLLQATYVHFDWEGVQNITRAIIAKGTLSRPRTFDLDENIDFKVGTLNIHNVDIHSIELNPKEFSFNIDEVHNGLQLQAKADKFIVSTYVELKVFGAYVGRGPLHIQVQNTQIGATMVFDRRQSDGGLTVGLKDGSLDKLKLGHAKVVELQMWWKQAVAYLTTPAINLILDIVKSKVSKAIADLVVKYGSEIPAQIALDGAFKGVVVPLSLTQPPLVAHGSVRLEFSCGGAKQIETNPTQNFMHIGLTEGCVGDILAQLYALPTSPINVTAIAQQISDVTEINTKTLGGIFPGFRQFKVPQDVKFEVTMKSGGSSNVKFIEGKAIIQAPVGVRLFLLQSQELQSRGLMLPEKVQILMQRKFVENRYVDFNVTAGVTLGTIKAAKGFAMSLEQLDTDSYELNEEDLKLLDIENWEDLKAVGLSFAMSFANQVLYQKLINVEGVLDLDQIQLQVLDGEIRVKFTVEE